MFHNKLSRLKALRHMFLCLLSLFVILAGVNYISCDFVQAESVSNQQTADVKLNKMGSVITTPPIYDEATGYYVQTITELNTEYDANTHCNVTTRKITTMYYLFDNGAYIFMSQSERTEILSSIPVSSESPMPSASAFPYQTATPAPTVIPSPAVTIAPTSTPVSFTMSTNEMKLTVSRKSDKKAKLVWKEVDDASGYYIYRSLKEKSGFKRVKTVEDPFCTTTTLGGLSKNKVYYFKITAYQVIDGIVKESKLNDPVQVSTITVKKITQKLKKLEKLFPDGRYWNHAGYKVSKGQKVYGFVTDTPCNHSRYSSHVAPTCNYYLGTDHVLGYQCSGYASLLSDKIFGKSKSKKHMSFKKAKVGDVVRYNGHSVFITEKHTDYIVVTECNYGNTCVIKWGRKIAKSKLNGAVYRTRY